MAKHKTRVRRSFTPQFNMDAVALVRAGRSVTAVAHDLGIARSLLQRWRGQLGEVPGAAVLEPGRRRPAVDEVRRLQQQLRDGTEERDILRKALAHFADDQK